VPHGECDCVPLASTVAGEASVGEQPALQPELAAETAPPSPQTEVAAEPGSPQPQEKHRWSDRLRSRLVSWKQSLGPHPQTSEGDLSELIGHTRFGTTLSD